MNWDCQKSAFDAFFLRSVHRRGCSLDSDHRITKSETRQNLPTGKQLIGKFENGQLSLVSAGSRFDIVMSADPRNQRFDENVLPKIDSWLAARAVFEIKTSQWLATCSTPIVRMAFGATLVFPTQSRHENYVKLRSLLKSVKVDPEAMRIFLRVNWPAKSEVVDGLVVNRLTNWGSLQIKSMFMQVSGASLAPVPTGPELHVVRLEIDHNTDQENTVPFSSDDLVPLYKELIAFAADNAEKGEKPSVANTVLWRETLLNRFLPVGCCPPMKIFPTKNPFNMLILRAAA